MIPTSLLLALWTLAVGYFIALASAQDDAIAMGSSSPPSWPSPGACVGDCINVQDMSVVISDSGKYYRFAGHNGIEIATSDSLIGPWTSSSQPAFPNWRTVLAHLKPQLQDVWAPDVRKIGDTYYMFFTVENFSTDLYGAGNEASAHYGDTVVATSKSLDGGTWHVQNTIDIPIHGPQYTRFDTSLLVEGNDIYMSFGSYSWGLFGMRMQNPPLQVLNQDVTELIADLPVPPAPLNTAPNKSEGSYLYKNNGFYYLFYASGDCCAPTLLDPGAEYKIMYCRASSVAGPYYGRQGQSCLTTTHGTLLLPSHGDTVYAPGSPTILDDPQHGLVMIYQYMNRKLGFGQSKLKMGWNPLHFENDWPVLLPVPSSTAAIDTTTNFRGSPTSQSSPSNVSGSAAVHCPSLLVLLSALALALVALVF